MNCVEEFDKILDYYANAGVKSKINAVVVIDVQLMSEVTSPSYDLGATKDELVDKWKKYYIFNDEIIFSKIEIEKF